MICPFTMRSFTNSSIILFLCASLKKPPENLFDTIAIVANASHSVKQSRRSRSPVGGHGCPVVPRHWAKTMCVVAICIVEIGKRCGHLADAHHALARSPDDEVSRAYVEKKVCDVIDDIVEVTGWIGVLEPAFEK